MTWHEPTHPALRASALYIFAAISCSVALHPQDLDPPLTKDEPLVQISLRQFGYPSSENSHLGKFIDFTDQNRVAVAWVAYDNPHAMKHTRPMVVAPAHLHV